MVLFELGGRRLVIVPPKSHPRDQETQIEWLLGHLSVWTTIDLHSFLMLFDDADDV